MCVCCNLTLHVVHESWDLRHIWYCVSEYQTPLQGSFETLQGYWLHFVRSLSKNRKQRDGRTGRNNVFPYFVNSTETWSCLNPSRFRPAETWWSSFPWTGRVSVMFPSRKRTIMFPPHFFYHISVLSCFHYVSGDDFFKPMSEIAW